MADFSLQLQADNLPIDTVEQLLVEGPWAPIMQRMTTAENVLLEGCRGAGKTMLMRAAAQKLGLEFKKGGRILGVHSTFKRYLATIPPPSESQDSSQELGNFRSWINARILLSLQNVLREHSVPEYRGRFGEVETVDWQSVVSLLETTYRGRIEPADIADELSLPRHLVTSLQGYTYTSNLLTKTRELLGLDLLIVYLDDAAHALDTRAQGAFFTVVKSLYEPGIAFKISVYPAVTRYGMDFSYGHDAVVVSLGDLPRKENMPAFRDLLARRISVADEASRKIFEAVVAKSEWVELLVYCANANPRALLKLIAQVQTQLAGREASLLRFEDVRAAINTVMDKHLDNMVPGVIKDLDRRLLRAAELLLDEFRQKISDKPGPYESTTKPRGYLAVTNSMQVPYLCQAALKLLVAANVVVPEGPARLSKRETGTVYLLHPGFMFRDNVIGPHIRGSLGAGDWNGFFGSLSTRVHAEVAKSAELWTEIVAEANSEPAGMCANGHPMVEVGVRCDVCGAVGQAVSPVSALLGKDISVLELSETIKERLRQHGFDTVRSLFEATNEEIDAVEYIGEKRTAQIRNAVSASVDEFVAG